MSWDKLKDWMDDCPLTNKDWAELEDKEISRRFAKFSTLQGFVHDTAEPAGLFSSLTLYSDIEEMMARWRLPENKDRVALVGPYTYNAQVIRRKWPDTTVYTASDVPFKLTVHTEQDDVALLHEDTVVPVWSQNIPKSQAIPLATGTHVGFERGAWRSFYAGAKPHSRYQHASSIIKWWCNAMWSSRRAATETPTMSLCIVNEMDPRKQLDVFLADALAYAEGYSRARDDVARNGWWKCLQRIRQNYAAWQRVFPEYSSISLLPSKHENRIHAKRTLRRVAKI